jgi:non-ribosomal peptide synthase protein (TIGR01720 family)
VRHPELGRPLLALAAHHLATDPLSWGPIVEDLETAYRSLAAGKDVLLPRKTTSHQRWGTLLAEAADSAARAEEEAYWRGVADGIEPLPADLPAAEDGEWQSIVATAVLDAESTGALTRSAHAALRVSMEEVVVYAATAAVHDVLALPEVLVELENNGRAGDLGDCDLSRTVGWFANVYPARIRLADLQRGTPALQRVADQLRATPDRGVGYGQLRYLATDPGVRERLAALPQPEVIIEYLGTVDVGRTGDQDFQLVPNPGRPPVRPRLHPLSMLAWVEDDRLHLRCESSPRFRAETVDRLLAETRARLTDVAAALRTPGAEPSTAGEPARTGLSARQLRRIHRALGEGEAR